jgi:hypothetical protein
MKGMIRIEYCTTGFLMIPMREVTIETDRLTGRFYYIWRDRIVAVAKRITETVQSQID